MAKLAKPLITGFTYSHDLTSKQSHPLSSLVTKHLMAATEQSELSSQTYRQITQKKTKDPETNPTALLKQQRNSPWVILSEEPQFFNLFTCFYTAHSNPMFEDNCDESEESEISYWERWRLRQNSSPSKRPSRSISWPKCL